LLADSHFYQRKEIKDVLAYLTLLVNPEDEQALLRIINEPSRGIGNKTLNELLKKARNSGSSVWRISCTMLSRPTSTNRRKRAYPIL
jgi:superfamily I DNA/RNA helicase